MKTRFYRWGEAIILVRDGVYYNFVSTLFMCICYNLGMDVSSDLGNNKFYTKFYLLLERNYTTWYFNPSASPK